MIRFEEFAHVIQALGDSLRHDQVHQVIADLDKYGDGMILIYDLVERIRPKSTEKMMKAYGKTR